MATQTAPAPDANGPAAPPAAEIGGGLHAALHASLARIERLSAELRMGGGAASVPVPDPDGGSTDDPFGRLDSALGAVRSLARLAEPGLDAPVPDMEATESVPPAETRPADVGEAEPRPTVDDAAEVRSPSEIDGETPAAPSQAPAAGPAPEAGLAACDDSRDDSGDDSGEGSGDDTGDAGPPEADSMAAEVIRYEVDDDRFTVDPEGVVRVRAGADFGSDAAAEIGITVTAHLADGSTDRQTFSVRLDAVEPEDAAADPDPAEDDPAVEDDAPATAPVAFEVDDARFVVDAEGVVRVAPGARFDLEAEAEVTLLVTAHAADGTSSRQAFTIRPADFAGTEAEAP